MEGLSRLAHAYMFVGDESGTVNTGIKFLRRRVTSTIG
jgi:hypothetical protein